MHGPTCIFWAGLTPFSFSLKLRNVDPLDNVSLMYRADADEAIGAALRAAAPKVC